MNKLRHILLFSIVLCLSITAVFAQTQNAVVRGNLSQAEVDRIVRTFTSKESEFRDSLKDYAFNRSAIIQTVGKLGGQVTGEYRRDSFMTFKENGERFEKIVFAPMSTLTEIRVTPEDLEDLGGVNPFALEPSAINLYNFTYMGKEKIDDLDLYVFDVAPKVIPDPRKTKQRLFIGRVWVDDRDLMIVKSKGKAIPETKDNKYPVVETWRENIDGKYWFPAYSYADDELVFDSGYVVRMRMRVKYTDYRLGRTEVRIIEEDEPEINPTPSPTPRKP
jgi:hypothetical protein